jgi:Fe-coproporphyrin III synthase
MCDIWMTREGQGFRAQDLETQLSSIRRLGVRWVVLTGGEPLLNPELPALCSTLREEGIRLTLLTTGLLLQRLAVEVAASFDEVIVSLDGPPKIHDTIRRVEGAFALIQSGILALRERRNDIKITARCTVQRANHHSLCATVEAAKVLKLNAISFLAADLASTAFNRPLVWPVSRQSEIGLSLAELAVLEAEIEGLVETRAKEPGSTFVVESPEKLRRIARHFRAHLGLEKNESPLCNAPWVSAVMEIDGTVRPCFFHKPIGNLHDDNLESVLNSDMARAFRAELDVGSNPICNRCVCSLHYRE